MFHLFSLYSFHMLVLNCSSRSDAIESTRGEDIEKIISFQDYPQ
jgi:hypothetical protein